MQHTEITRQRGRGVACETADVIVLLGCTVEPSGEPTAALQRRMNLAARAFHSGTAPRVIVSGGRRWGAHAEAVVMQRGLLERRVPADVIAMELFSLSTAENCWFTAELIAQLGWAGPRPKLFVATCAWHLPRATRNFARVHCDVVQPPSAWLDTPAPTMTRRVRERVNTLLDWCMMPRARHA